jgi:hypothetical protein
MLGLALTVDYTSLIGLGVFGAYLLWRRRWHALGWMAQGGVMPLALLGLYHQAAFGSPWHTPYQHLAFSQLLAPGLVGSQPWVLREPGRLLSLLAGFPEGVLATMPLLLLAAAGLARLSHDPAGRPVAALCGAMGLAYLLGLTAVELEALSMGGVGPRYFMPGIPFLLLGLAVPYGRSAMSQPWSALRRVGENLLLAGSMAVNVLAAFYGRMLVESPTLVGLFQQFGLTSYTLRELNQHGLLTNPALSTGVVLAVLLLAGWQLQRRRMALPAAGLPSR